jgi:hypothetical protein
MVGPEDAGRRRLGFSYDDFLRRMDILPISCSSVDIASARVVVASALNSFDDADCHKLLVLLAVAFEVGAQVQERQRLHRA